MPALALLILATQAGRAQSAADAGEPNKAQSIVVTGTRLKSLSVTAMSPVAQTSAEQIGLWRAASVEDFSARLPQLAGGVSGASVGSDAFGAQTLDLRNLGQSRTLVLWGQRPDGATQRKQATWNQPNLGGQSRLRPLL